MVDLILAGSTVTRLLRYLPPAYVVRREGNSFTLLVCPHLGGGGVSVQPGGGGQASGGGSVGQG